MNNFIFFLAVTLDINLTNFTEQVFVYAFDPYVSLFGNLTWGLIFGFMGAGLYVGSNSTKTAFTYLVVMGLIFGIILPEVLIAIAGLIAAFIATAYLFKTYVYKES